MLVGAMELWFGGALSWQERNRSYYQVDGVSPDLYWNGVRSIGLVNGIAVIGTWALVVRTMPRDVADHEPGCFGDLIPANIETSHA